MQKKLARTFSFDDMQAGASLRSPLSDDAMTAAVAAAPAAIVSEEMFTWEKLSPAEFQQLQDFAACK